MLIESLYGALPEGMGHTEMYGLFFFYYKETRCRKIFIELLDS